MSKRTTNTMIDMTADDIAMEIERAQLHTPRKLYSIMSKAVMAGFSLDDTVSHEVLLNTEGCRAWARVLESDIPLLLDEQKIVDLVGEWLSTRISTGDGDDKIEDVVGRGLRAIERRSPGMGRNVATEMMEVAVDIWDMHERPEDSMGTMAQAMVRAMVMAGADCNEAKSISKGKPATLDNLVHVLVRKDVKSKRDEPNVMVNLLIELGARWQGAYEDKKLGQRGKRLLEYSPIVRRELLETVADTSRSRIVTRNPKL